MKGKTCRPFAWEVTKDIKREETGEDIKFEETGVSGFDSKHAPNEPLPEKFRNGIDFLELLVHLLLGNWQDQVRKLNRRVREKNELMRKLDRTNFMEETSPSEFWVFWGFVFDARVHRRRGSCVWVTHRPDGVHSKVNFQGHMKKTMHWEIKRFIKWLFKPEDMCGTGDWQKISAGVKGSNKTARGQFGPLLSMFLMNPCLPSDPNDCNG